jgi:hypothetical protein
MADDSCQMFEVDYNGVVKGNNFLINLSSVIRHLTTVICHLTIMLLPRPVLRTIKIGRIFVILLFAAIISCPAVVEDSVRHRGR